jgi:hypothetical protein
MKTLKIFIVLCFIAAFAANNVKAQNGVIKGEDEGNADLYIECTGDQLDGPIVVEYMIMRHNLVFRVRKTNMIGLPSGKEYVIMQVSPGYSNFVNHLQIWCEGKLVAVIQVNFHITVNANDEVTVEFFREDINCLNK